MHSNGQVLLRAFGFETHKTSEAKSSKMTRYCFMLTPDTMIWVIYTFKRSSLYSLFFTVVWLNVTISKDWWWCEMETFRQNNQKEQPDISIVTARTWCCFCDSLLVLFTGLIIDRGCGFMPSFYFVVPLQEWTIMTSQLWMLPMGMSPTTQILFGFWGEISVFIFWLAILYQYISEDKTSTPIENFALAIRAATNKSCSKLPEF